MGTVWVWVQNTVAHRGGAPAGSHDGRLGREALTVNAVILERDPEPDHPNTIPRSSHNSELILACCDTMDCFERNTVALAF